MLEISVISPIFLQPVQGFDYAKQHLGQQGAEDEVLPVTQETVILPLPVRDAPASQERETTQDGSTIKTAKSNETRKRYGLASGIFPQRGLTGYVLLVAVRFGSRALRVADGSSKMYPWHNAGLCWMCKIAAKYEVKPSEVFTGEVRWLLYGCWCCTRDEPRWNMGPVA